MIMETDNIIFFGIINQSRLILIMQSISLSTKVELKMIDIYIAFWLMFLTNKLVAMMITEADKIDQYWNRTLG